MGVTASTYTTKVVKQKKKSKYLVIGNKENTLEFLIKVKTNKEGFYIYKLFYSNAEFWSLDSMGKLILTMTEFNDGMIFNLVGRKDLSELNYSELEAFRILTMFEQKIPNKRYTITKI